MIAPLEFCRSDDPDAQLMARVRAGDDALFADLYVRHRPRIVGLISRLQGMNGDAEDLAQQVFVRAYSARRSYCPSAKFSTWLSVIARNVVFNARRDAARRPSTVSASADRFVPQPPDSSANSEPPHIAIRSEIQEVVQAAIDELGEHQRSAVRLIFEHGLRQRAAAAELRLSETAVKSLLQRAKSNLRSRLESAIGDAD